MADQRAQYNEEAVGANHPTKADVINRLALVEHGTDGVHGATARASMGTAPLVLGSDADGDMYYRASGKLARLAKGTAYQHLGVNSGATAPQWQASANSVLTAAGDILYASGANTLARLAKGTANYKLFMNAGATAPEWANGMKVIYAERALDGATADVAYTGVGFKPSGLVAIATIDGADKFIVGFHGGGVSMCISQYGAVTYHVSGDFLRIYDNAVNKYQGAAVKSFDSDGLTITWTRGAGGSAAGTIKFTLMCFR